jgi:hypothetical protein
VAITSEIRDAALPISMLLVYCGISISIPSTAGGLSPTRR